MRKDIIKSKMLFEINKKLDFFIWKYSGTISKCLEPQLLLETFQRDLDELKDILKVDGWDGVNRKEHKVQSDLKNPPVNLLHPDVSSTNQEYSQQPDVKGNARHNGEGECTESVSRISGSGNGGSTSREPSADTPSTKSEPVKCGSWVYDDDGTFKCGVEHKKEIKLCGDCEEDRQEAIKEYCAKCGFLESFHPHNNIFIRQEGHKSITSTCKKFIHRDAEDTLCEVCKNCGRPKSKHYYQIEKKRNVYYCDSESRFKFVVRNAEDTKGEQVYCICGCHKYYHGKFGCSYCKCKEFIKQGKKGCGQDILCKYGEGRDFWWKCGKVLSELDEVIFCKECLQDRFHAPKGCGKNILHDDEGSFRCGVKHKGEMKLCDKCQEEWGEPGSEEFGGNR